MSMAIVCVRKLAIIATPRGQRPSSLDSHDPYAQVLLPNVVHGCFMSAAGTDSKLVLIWLQLPPLSHAQPGGL
jgi:hypothetical protein